MLLCFLPKVVVRFVERSTVRAYTDECQTSVVVFVLNRVKIQAQRYVVYLVQHHIGPIQTVSHADKRELYRVAC